MLRTALTLNSHCKTKRQKQREPLRHKIQFDKATLEYYIEKSISEIDFHLVNSIISGDTTVIAEVPNDSIFAGYTSSTR